MKCPHCAQYLEPWPWQDGGYRGVKCSKCELCWWSDSFSKAAYEAEQKAIENLMARSSFPQDAKEPGDGEGRPPLADDEWADIDHDDDED